VENLDKGGGDTWKVKVKGGTEGENTPNPGGTISIKGKANAWSKKDTSKLGKGKSCEDVEKIYLQACGQEGVVSDFPVQKAQARPLSGSKKKAP